MAHANEEAYKLKSKAAYNMSAKPRSFGLGDMVLCHTPGLTGKLHSIWEGPYEVISKTSCCNYKIAEESKRTPEPIGKVKMSDPVLSIVQKAQLHVQAILDELSDVVTIELGSVKGEAHVILTDGSTPVHSVPYRIAPGWREDL